MVLIIMTFVVVALIVMAFIIMTLVVVTLIVMTIVCVRRWINPVKMDPIAMLSVEVTEVQMSGCRIRVREIPVGRFAHGNFNPLV